jgi:protein-S-isoprenylcysteine O-methyltransferase Ste14
MTNAPWWKGTRGEWYFVVQLVLFALITLAPLAPGQPEWLFPVSLAARGLGLVLRSSLCWIVAGFALATAGLLGLGRNLSPLPHPRDDATLVEGGVYGLVRHPIYAGLIMGALGWALLTNSLLALGLAVLLLVFFDVKSRREERALLARFPAYADYRRRVRKFFPFIY